MDVEGVEIRRAPKSHFSSLAAEGVIVFSYFIFYVLLLLFYIHLLIAKVRKIGESGLVQNGSISYGSSFFFISAVFVLETNGFAK